MESNATSSAPIPQLPKTEGPSSLASNSWNFLKIHWKSLIPLAMVPVVLFFIAQLLMGVGAGVGLTGKAFTGVGFGLIALIIILVGVVLTIISQPAIILAIQRLQTDPAAPITIAGQYKLGMPLFGSVLFLLIISMFILLGSTLLLIIPGIIVSVYVVMYMFALVIDGKKGFSALVESYDLIKGRWWDVLGSYIVLGVILVAAQLIISGIGVVAGSIVSMILNIIVNPAMTVFSMIYLYRLYISLKLTRSTQAPTTSFKNWLITFMIVGMIGIIAIPVIGAAVLATIFASSEFRNNLPKLEQMMKDAERNAKQGNYDVDSSRRSPSTDSSVIPASTDPTTIPPAVTSPTSTSTTPIQTPNAY
jgi:hypothetical protein